MNTLKVQLFSLVYLENNKAKVFYTCGSRQIKKNQPNNPEP